MQRLAGYNQATTTSPNSPSTLYLTSIPYIMTPGKGIWSTELLYWNYHHLRWFTWSSQCSSLISRGQDLGPEQRTCSNSTSQRSPRDFFFLIYNTNSSASSYSCISPQKDIQKEKQWPIHRVDVWGKAFNAWEKQYPLGFQRGSWPARLLNGQD